MILKIHSLRASFIAILCAFLFVLPSVELHSQTAKTIHGGDSIGPWAYDAASGRLFRLDYENKQVNEFSIKTGKRTKQHKLDFAPEKIIFKNGFALIQGSTRRANVAAIFELKSNKVKNRISLGSVSEIFVTDDTNDFVYLNTDTFDGSKVVQIDLRKAAKTKELKLRKEIEQLPRKNIVSHMLPGMVRIDNYFVQLDERAMRFKKVHVLAHDTEVEWQQIKRAIGKRLVETEKGILDSEFKKIFYKDEIFQCRMHPKLDLVASVQADSNKKDAFELKFNRFSDKAKLGSVSLKPRSSVRERFNMTGTPTVFEFDDQRSLFVIGHGDYLHVIDTSAIVKKVVPRLIVDLEKNHRGMANRDLAIPIKLLSRPLGSRAKFKLESAPDGMKIENDTIVWKPANKQMGRHKIKLVAADGKISDQIELKVSILTEHIKFDGPIPRGFTRGNGNDLVAVWCVDGQRGRSVTEAKDENSRIFVIDVANRKIVSEFQTKEYVERVWLGKEFVYFVSDVKTSLYRYPARKPEKPQRVFLRGDLQGLEIYLQKYVYANVRIEGDSQILAIARDDFKLKSFDGHGISIDLPGYQQQPMFSQGDLVQVSGRLIDRKTGQVHCMLENGPIPELVTEKKKTRFGTREIAADGRESSTRPVVGKVWGRQVVYNHLLDGEATRIRTFKVYKSTISTRYPVGVKLMLDRVDNSNDIKSELHFFELAGGEVKQKTRLEIRASVDELGFSGIDLVGDQVVVIVGDRLYFKALDEQLKKLPEPLWIRPPRIQPIELGGKTQSFKIETNRTGADLQFKLQGSVTGISIDSKTGVVTIDGSKLIARKFNEMRYRVRAGTAESRQKQIDQMESKGEFGESDNMRFKNATGFDLKKGFRGYCLNARISAVEGSGQSDSWEIAIPVLVKSEYIERYLQLAKSKGGEIRPETILPISMALGEPRTKLMLIKHPDRGRTLKPGEVVSMGHWGAFKSVFSGGKGVIYAISHDGNLLCFREDPKQKGKFGKGKVISSGEWHKYHNVFYGGDGIIYAITKGVGKLLFIKHTSTKEKDDVSKPKVIGISAWASFKFVFYGGNGLIYAVSNNGRLLAYKDEHRDGRGGGFPKPTVVGVGGWSAFKTLFSDGEGGIYAITPKGQMRYYHDPQKGGTGRIDKAYTISKSGWSRYKFVFSGGAGIIYATRD